MGRWLSGNTEADVCFMHLMLIKRQYRDWRLLHAFKVRFTKLRGEHTALEQFGVNDSEYSREYTREMSAKRVVKFIRPPQLSHV